MRHRLRQMLRPFLNERGIVEETFFIGVLSPANYEFAVAAFSILAVGAAFVALRMLLALFQWV